MENCLYLHDSYITKFDFMNYAFANLVLAWLYIEYTMALSMTRFNIHVQWSLNKSYSDNSKYVFMTE